MRLINVVLVLAVIAPAAGAQQPDTTPAPRDVRGVVVTPNDAPLARVRVAVKGAPASQPPVFTDARGEFVVPAGDAASVRLEFAKAGYAPLTVDVARAQLNAPMRVRLSRGGAISGQVQDRAGVRVMLASVSARRTGAAASADAPPIAATTNDLGEFRL